MAGHMKAIDIKSGKGSADALFINEAYSRPSVTEPGRIVVKVKCFGVNRMDLLQREGRYPVPPQAKDLVLGVEFSGTVDAVGPEQPKSSNDEGAFEVGHEVFGLAYGGAYAEYVSVSPRMLIHKPAELSWEVAAGIPETWITATQAMYLVGTFEPGKSILWHAGASSVSIAGIQLSRANGASKILVTAGSDEKIEFCQSLGASRGFNYRDQPQWADGVLEATDGKGVDVIVDYIGANYFQQNLKAAAKDGRIVALGALSGTKLPPDVDIGDFVAKRIRYEGSTLRSRDEKYQGRLRDMLCENALPHIVSGEFEVPIDQVFQWTQIVEAHKLMESNTTKGKIICRVTS